MKLVELGPHSNMSSEECLAFCKRNYEEYEAVIVIGLNPTGKIFLRSSKMSRAEAVFYLLEAIDEARGSETVI